MIINESYDQRFNEFHAIHVMHVLYYFLFPKNENWKLKSKDYEFNFSTWQAVPLIVWQLTHPDPDPEPEPEPDSEPEPELEPDPVRQI